MAKSIPLSVRISADDATFLAEVEIQDAVTPSDKLRAILADARQRASGSDDIASALALVERMLRPVLHRILSAQREQGLRSDFVLELYARLPELFAGLLAAGAAATGGATGMRKWEAGIADQVFAFIEEMLKLGLVSQSRTYSSTLIRDRLKPSLEILRLLETAQSTNEGEAR